MNNFHKPVLLKEAIDYLDVRKGAKYIDVTLGGGGHTTEILKRGGIVLGVDVDEDALDFVRNKKKEIENWQSLTLTHGNFKDIDKIAHLNSFDKAAGIIFDLGVSSFQIDAPERGFSYQKESTLDMRMDKSLTVTAADLINILTKRELNELFNKLGEERSAWIISERIVRSRRVKKIETTDELVRIIQGGLRTSAFERARVLKRVFQALRIAVNDELNSLKEGLPKAISLLEKDGRLVVVSFHSLEDRIVKETFEDYRKRGAGETLTKKPIVPTTSEILENRRSKSAKMRVFRKT